MFVHVLSEKMKLSSALREVVEITWLIHQNWRMHLIGQSAEWSFELLRILSLDTYKIDVTQIVPTRKVRNIRFIVFLFVVCL